MFIKSKDFVSSTGKDVFPLNADTNPKWNYLSIKNADINRLEGTFRR